VSDQKVEHRARHSHRVVVVLAREAQNPQCQAIQ
jgi:hypothetical protein